MRETLLLLLVSIMWCGGILFPGCANAVLVERLIISPQDPAVCMSTNVTFICTWQGRASNESVGFMYDNHVIQHATMLDDQTAEFTLYNITITDNHAVICCTKGKKIILDTMSILTVYINKEHSGTLIPIDPDVCTAQNFTFTCTLDDTPKLNTSIGFAVKNESMYFVAVDKDDIVEVNETVSQYTVYNMTPLKNSNYFVVRCYYGHYEGHFDLSKQLGETSSAVIYTMPQEVVDFQCIVKDYLRTMNCSWDYGIAYKPVKPHVTFQWRINHLSSSWTPCSDLNVEYGYCYWSSTRVGDFSMKDIEIRLISSQPCGVNVTTHYHINTAQQVKPLPVVDLSVNVVNSTCLHATWISTRREYPKEHRVIVSSMWGYDTTYKYNTSDVTESQPQSRLFCDLHPHTKYTFSVSVKPIEGGFYSDSRSHDATTYSSIPSSSPEVIEGGYMWRQRDCDGENAKRRVCLFWKSIKHGDENGIMKGLIGEFGRAAGDLSSSLVEHWDLAWDLTYSCSATLPCNTSLNFAIKARNDIGTSEEVSMLHIPSSSSGIEQPKFIVESTNTTDPLVFVNWPSYPDASNFTVAWCRQHNGDCNNTNPVNWKIFPGNTTEAELRIKSPDDYLYGVGVTTEHGTSGLEWQNCVYGKYGFPSRQPENVIVTPGSEDDTLVITWDKLACSPGEPFIEIYIVQYSMGIEENWNVGGEVTSSGEARLVLEHLNAEFTYTITVRGVTRDNMNGPESIPQIATPVNKSLDAGEITGIIMVGLLSMIFAAVGCVCVVRKCKKQGKSYLANMRSVTLPEGPEPFKTAYVKHVNSFPDGKVQSELIRQDSGDSGYDPMTPPVESTNVAPKFENIKLECRPDGYCVATEVDKTHSTTQQVRSLTSQPNMDNLPKMPVNAQVGHVRREFQARHKEIEHVLEHVTTEVNFVDEIPLSSETAAKQRSKNESRDSGVSDAYSKATCREPLESISNVDNEGTSNKVSDYCTVQNNNSSGPTHPENPNSCSKMLSTNVSVTGPEHCAPNNTSKLHINIPIPLAFIECSEIETSRMDEEMICCVVPFSESRAESDDSSTDSITHNLEPEDDHIRTGITSTECSVFVEPAQPDKLDRDNNLEVCGPLLTIIPRPKSDSDESEYSDVNGDEDSSDPAEAVAPALASVSPEAHLSPTCGFVASASLQPPTSKNSVESSAPSTHNSSHRNSELPVSPNPFREHVSYLDVLSTVGSTDETNANIQHHKQDAPISLSGIDHYVDQTHANIQHQEQDTPVSLPEVNGYVDQTHANMQHQEQDPTVSLHKVNSSVDQTHANMQHQEQDTPVSLPEVSHYVDQTHANIQNQEQSTPVSLPEVNHYVDQTHANIQHQEQGTPVSLPEVNHYVDQTRANMQHQEQDTPVSLPEVNHYVDQTHANIEHQEQDAPVSLPGINHYVDQTHANIKHQEQDTPVSLPEVSHYVDQTHANIEHQEQDTPVSLPGITHYVDQTPANIEHQEQDTPVSLPEVNHYVDQTHANIEHQEQDTPVSLPEVNGYVDQTHANMQHQEQGTPVSLPGINHYVDQTRANIEHHEQDTPVSLPEVNHYVDPTHANMQHQEQDTPVSLPGINGYVDQIHANMQHQEPDTPVSLPEANFYVDQTHANMQHQEQDTPVSLPGINGYVDQIHANMQHQEQDTPVSLPGINHYVDQTHANIQHQEQGTPVSLPEVNHYVDQTHANIQHQEQGTPVSLPEVNHYVDQTHANIEHQEQDTPVSLPEVNGYVDQTHANIQHQEQGTPVSLPGINHYVDQTHANIEHQEQDTPVSLPEVNHYVDQTHANIEHQEQDTPVSLPEVNGYVDQTHANMQHQEQGTPVSLPGINHYVDQTRANIEHHEQDTPVSLPEVNHYVDPTHANMQHQEQDTPVSLPGINGYVDQIHANMQHQEQGTPVSLPEANFYVDQTHANMQHQEQDTPVSLPGINGYVDQIHAKIQNQEQDTPVSLPEINHYVDQTHANIQHQEQGTPVSLPEVNHYVDQTHANMQHQEPDTPVSLPEVNHYVDQTHANIQHQEQGTPVSLPEVNHYVDQTHANIQHQEQGTPVSVPEVNHYVDQTHANIQHQEQDTPVSLPGINHYVDQTHANIQHQEQDTPVSLPGINHYVDQTHANIQHQEQDTPVSLPGINHYIDQTHANIQHQEQDTRVSLPGLNGYVDQTHAKIQHQEQDTPVSLPGINHYVDQTHANIQHQEQDTPVSLYEVNGYVGQTPANIQHQEQSTPVSLPWINGYVDLTHASKRDSDSGLSSMEEDNPDTDQRESEDDFAMSVQPASQPAS